MSLISFIRDVGHKIHNIHLPNPVTAFQHTFMPSAEVGAARRQAVFGTTSKLPPIATAAVIASSGLATIPAVVAATSRVAAPVAENVLQTAVKYVGNPTFAGGGGVAGFAGRAAAGMGITTGIIETGNFIEAAASGDWHKLMPTNYQAATILGSSLFPGAAHISALLGFAGRGIKSLFEHGAQAVDTGVHDFTNAASTEIPHVIVDFGNAAKNTLHDFANEGKIAYNFLGSEMGNIGGLVSGYATGLAGMIPQIPTNFNMDIGSKQLDALLALAGAGGLAAYALHRHKRKKYKHRRTYKRHGRRQSHEQYIR